MKRSFLLLLILFFVLSLPLFAAHAGGEAPPELDTGFAEASITVPKGKEARIQHLTDGNYMTRLTLGKGESIELNWIDSAARNVYAEWYTLPPAFIVTLLDASGGVLGAPYTVENASHLSLLSVEGAMGMRITSPRGELSLCTLRACTDAFVPPFDLSAQQADVLVVLAEPTDETLRLGGLLAQLAGENGVSTKVVYAVSREGCLTHQAFAALRALGVEQYPEIWELPHRDAIRYGNLLNNFGGEKAMFKRLVGLIRRVQPKIVVTLDNRESAEDALEYLVSDLAVRAAAAAANPEGCKDIPVHTVERVFCARGDGNVFCDWTLPLINFDGQSAQQVAAQAYANYEFEKVYRRGAPALTTLLRMDAEGEAGTALLDGFDTARLSAYVEPMPIPTIAPTPTPAPARTATPEVAPAAAQMQDEPRTPTPSPLRWLPFLIGVVLAVCLFVLLKKHGWRRYCISAVALILGLTGSLLLSGGLQRADRAVAAEPVTTVAPTASPVQTTTPAPVPEPTTMPEPSITPDPNAQYFRQEGEPEEVIVSDFENGVWTYRSDALSIYVERVVTVHPASGGPVVSYVADIRMRGYSSFRSGSRDFVMPWRYARLERTVLAITGDNLVSAEKEAKGCLIRNGRFYANCYGADTLVVREDMTLETMRPRDFTTQQLLDEGVRHSYSFGPTLVENGEIYELIHRHRVGKPNPRCGIGMVEPGHWVAIATDGRQADYSWSIDLPTFAQMFIDNGCTVAYNLDGGSSVGMVFMGETLTQHGGPGTTDSQRSWTDALMWGYSPLVPDDLTQTEHDGIRVK